MLITQKAELSSQMSSLKVDLTSQNRQTNQMLITQKAELSSQISSQISQTNQMLSQTNQMLFQYAESVNGFAKQSSYLEGKVSILEKKR